MTDSVPTVKVTLMMQNGLTRASKHLPQAKTTTRSQRSTPLSQRCVQKRSVTIPGMKKIRSSPWVSNNHSPQCFSSPPSSLPRVAHRRFSLRLKTATYSTHLDLRFPTSLLMLKPLSRRSTTADSLSTSLCLELGLEARPHISAASNSEVMHVSACQVGSSPTSQTLRPLLRFPCLSYSIWRRHGRCLNSRRYMLCTLVQYGMRSQVKP